MGEHEERQGESSEEQIVEVEQGGTGTAQDESTEHEIVTVETEMEE